MTAPLKPCVTDMTIGATCSLYTLSCDALWSTASKRHVHESCALAFPSLGMRTVSERWSSWMSMFLSAKLAVGRVRIATLTDMATCERREERTQAGLALLLAEPTIEAKHTLFTCRS
eukprot:5435199-Prymnesium_polylepis.2